VQKGYEKKGNGYDGRKEMKHYTEINQTSSVYFSLAVIS